MNKPWDCDYYKKSYKVNWDRYCENYRDIYGDIIKDKEYMLEDMIAEDKTAPESQKERELREHSRALTSQEEQLKQEEEALRKEQKRFAKDKKKLEEERAKFEQEKEELRKEKEFIEKLKGAPLPSPASEEGEDMTKLFT